jgi:hypothetical protein
LREDGREATFYRLSVGHKIAASQLSFILNNARSPSPEICIAIAAGLDLQEIFRARGWLLNPSQELTNIDPRTERIARRVSALPTQSREIALNAIEPVLESVYQLNSPKSEKPRRIRELLMEQH